MRPSMEHLASAFAQRPDSANLPEWLTMMQNDSWKRARSHGLPWRKDEHWKYTSLYNLAKLELRAPETPASDLTVRGSRVYQNDHATVIEWRNGRPLTSMSLPGGVSFRTLGGDVPSNSDFLTNEPARHSVMQDINQAFADTVCELTVAANTRVELPVYLLQELQGNNVLASQRLHINVGDNSELDLVDHLVGSGSDNVNNRHLSIFIGANSHVRHTLIQQDDLATSLINNVDVAVSRDANYVSQVFDLGARLARHDLGISLNGENAHCSMVAAYLPHDEQHVDHHTLVKHNKPNTHSEQRYNGVAGFKGHGVFNGKVLVQPDAQKITAAQSNQNILLCDQAAVDTKPELEIYADDVKCSHGATVGQLDETALFYLQSRGLGKHQAQQLLVQGFVRDIYANIRCKTLHDWLDKAITSKLDELVSKLQ